LEGKKEVNVGDQKSLDLARVCAAAAEEKFGANIIVLEVGELTSIADYFVLCTANSSPHLRAVVANIEEQTRKKLGIKPRRCDGDSESAWILMDYTTVLVHVMSPETRDKYNLESLWSDAPKIEAVNALVDLATQPQ